MHVLYCVHILSSEPRSHHTTARTAQHSTPPLHFSDPAKSTLFRAQGIYGPPSRGSIWAGPNRRLQIHPCRCTARGLSVFLGRHPCPVKLLIESQYFISFPGCPQILEKLIPPRPYISQLPFPQGIDQRTSSYRTVLNLSTLLTPHSKYISPPSPPSCLESESIDHTLLSFQQQ